MITVCTSERLRCGISVGGGNGPLAGRQGALAFAKNGTGDTGNVNFPFDIASHYNDVDGDERLDR